MYLYIELWKAKDAWKQLSARERQDLLEQLLAEAKKNPIAGVLPCSVRQVGDAVLFDGVTEQPVVIDDGVARPTGFRYAAAWMIPTRELIDRFERRVENLGWWFKYFEQENAWGSMDVQATIKDMVNVGGAERPPAKPAEAKRGLVDRIRTTEADVQDIKNSLSQILEAVRR